MSAEAPRRGAYRRCVGIALFNAQGLVFVGRRANETLREHSMPGHEWQMPQGGIDAGETPLAAARRELAEETGVSAATLLGEARAWFTYDLPVDVSKSAWKGRYCGQTQKWFAFRFDGADSAVNILNPPGGHKAEFAAWRWERLARLPELIIPFKRGVYEQVVAEFGGFAAS